MASSSKPSIFDSLSAAFSKEFKQCMVRSEMHSIMTGESKTVDTDDMLTILETLTGLYWIYDWDSVCFECYDQTSEVVALSHKYNEKIEDHVAFGPASYDILRERDLL